MKILYIRNLSASCCHYRYNLLLVLLYVLLLLILFSLYIFLLVTAIKQKDSTICIDTKSSCISTDIANEKQLLSTSPSPFSPRLTIQQQQYFSESICNLKSQSQSQSQSEATTTTTTTATTTETTKGIAYISDSGSSSTLTKMGSTTSTSTDTDTKDEVGGSGIDVVVRIAFMGNSILYYNDSPRLIQQMIESASASASASTSTTATPGGGGRGGIKVVQDCCLRGGATITSLWREGNGMHKKFTNERSLVTTSSGSTVSSTTERLVKGEDEVTTTMLQQQQQYYYDIGSETIKSMLMKYNGQWDYIVMNDYTQGPARTKTRTETIHTMKQHIIPLLLAPIYNGCTPPIIIILQTQAYRRENIKDTKDLGSFHEFTNKLRTGVQEYKKVLEEELLPAIRAGGANNSKTTCSTTSNTDNNNNNTNNTNNSNNTASPPEIVRIAPVGEAYLWFHDHNKVLFHKLYSWDDFHPSPYGTWLQACIIYCTCYPNKQPPIYNPQWYTKSRYMMPSPDHDKYYQLQYPTSEEAEELRIVACMICGVPFEK